MATLDGWGKTTSPFHDGEQAVQARMGVRERIEPMGRAIIRPYMPDQHRDFFAGLPFIVLGSVDPSGQPWASLLFGEPGFVSAPDEKTLNLSVTPLASDPLSRGLKVGAPIGLLGIELPTRRRNRANGHISALEDTTIHLAIDQSFGNCPQYIQTRTLTHTYSVNQKSDPSPPETLTKIDEKARGLIETADTFFVASYVSADGQSDIRGVDVSHRGGRPGFVKIDGNTLTIPDYTGNFMFNTLGNFIKNPKAGLVFWDFETGDILHLTGSVDILWDDHPSVKAFEGADRAWRFTLKEGVSLSRAAGSHWRFGEYSPNTLITGDWETAEKTLAAENKRMTWRTFRVARTEDESTTIRSFYLEPDDDEGLASFKAGQYLTLRTTPASQERSIIRTYTVSSAPGEPHYRISVKRESDGGVSAHLHDTLHPGDRIDIRAPKGDFILNAKEERPALLLAGGVGITPMIAMARHVLQEGLRTRHIRPMTIFHATGSTEERAFHQEFRELEQYTQNTIRYYSLVDRAAENEKAGTDFNGVGPITADMLRQTLPLDDYDVYLCGPAGFIQAMYDLVRKLGIQDTRIFAEAFGPASLKRTADVADMAYTLPDVADATAVRFAKADFEQGWTPADGSLLDLAEAHGLSPDYGCRSGSCGTCAVRLLSGQVTYAPQPTGDVVSGHVLICCARPAKGTAHLTLDL